MMGEQKVMQEELFYGFSLQRHVPADHLLRSIDRFVDLSAIRQHLAPYYSQIGRPSIDPERLIRMLIVGYCFGIRSERRLCEEVHLNLAYRRFCRLGLEGDVPDHSTFSKARHGRFRDADLLRELFETVVRRCMAEGLVGGEGFAVDASLNIIGQSVTFAMVELIPQDRLYLDDLYVGQRFASATDTIDEAQIKAFAARFDPQPFHIDEKAAAMNAAFKPKRANCRSPSCLANCHHLIKQGADRVPQTRHTRFPAQRGIELWPEPRHAKRAQLQSFLQFEAGRRIAVSLVWERACKQGGRT